MKIVLSTLFALRPRHVFAVLSAVPRLLAEAALETRLPHEAAVNDHSCCERPRW